MRNKNSNLILYHAAPSYFSQIVRLALIERNIKFKAIEIDIHVKTQQLSDKFIQLNPKMTVPVLISEDNEITESRDILSFLQTIKALGESNEKWISELYSFPTEELTFSSLMEKFPPGKFLFKRKIQSMIAKLEKRILIDSNNRDVLEKKISVLEGRNTFLDPSTLVNAKEKLLVIFGKLNKALDETPWLGGSEYGNQDIILSCFLARLEMIGLSKDIDNGKNLSSYYSKVKQRPSFAKANIWNKISFTHVLREHLGLIGTNLNIS